MLQQAFGHRLYGLLLLEHVELLRIRLGLQCNERWWWNGHLNVQLPTIPLPSNKHPIYLSPSGTHPWAKWSRKTSVGDSKSSKKRKFIFNFFQPMSHRWTFKTYNKMALHLLISLTLYRIDACEELDLNGTDLSVFLNPLIYLVRIDLINSVQRLNRHGRMAIARSLDGFALSAARKTNHRYQQSHPPQISTIEANPNLIGEKWLEKYVLGHSVLFTMNLDIS